MAQSIADVLQSTGSIPQVSAGALQPPPDADSFSGAQKENNDTFSRLIDTAQKDSNELKQKGRDASARIEANEKKIDDLKVPQPPSLTPPPEAKKNNPFESFGSAAGWIAVFGSMLTRAPLTSSMNAAAAAMNAVKQNNAEAFKENMETWKANTENALKLHQFEVDAYKNDLEKLKAGDESALTDVQVTAASFKNDTLQLLAAKGQADAVIKQIEAQAKMSTQMAKSADRAEQIGFAQQDIMMHPEWTPKQKAQRMAEATSSAMMAAGMKADAKKEETEAKNKPTYDEDMIARAGQAIIDGVRPNVAVPGYGSKNPNRDAALKWASDHAPEGWNMANAELDYQGRSQEERTASVIAAKTKFATHSLDNSLPLLKEAVKHVDLKGLTDINAVENYYRSHTSDPDFRKFVTAMQTTITDYSSLIARNGQSTDSTRAQAREILNETMSSGGIEAVIDQMQKEARAQLDAASKTTGRDEGGLRTFSSGEYKEAIKSKKLKSGDHFLDSKGVEHVVQ